MTPRTYNLGDWLKYLREQRAVQKPEGFKTLVEFMGFTVEQVDAALKAEDEQ